MSVVLQLVAGLFLADFVSGLVHWAEDTFGTESTPLVGRWIVTPNVLHHRDPTAFVRKGWLASSWDLVAAAALFLVLARALGMLGPAAILFAIAGANANQIHKWCHAPSTAPLLVRALWRAHIMQTPRQHAAHHRGEKNEAYCVVTPFLNPALDRIRFWRLLERCIVPLTGAPRREDLSGLRRIRFSGARNAARPGQRMPPFSTFAVSNARAQRKPRRGTAPRSRCIDSSRTHFPRRS